MIVKTYSVDSLATDARTVGAGQEDEASSNLRRLTGSSNGRSELLLSFLVHGCGNQRSPDRARGDRVHTDAATAVLVRKTTGKGDNGTLGAGVVEKIGATDIGVHRGVIDDGVTGLHVGQTVLGQVEEGVDVGVEGELPLLPAKISVL